jgi:hypothetical protein
VEFNTTRFELETLANGGICLRFEELSETTLLFTYSRCHLEDHFNKKVAKAVADKRSEAAKSDIRLMSAMSIDTPLAMDTASLAAAVIKHCREWKPDPEEHLLVLHYLAVEWQGFINALENLNNSNLAQGRIGKVWKGVVNNLFQKTYSSDK